MGRKISNSNFTKEDFKEFQKKLNAETEILGTWFEEGIFDDTSHLCGFELEACLVGSDYRPKAAAEQLLKQLDHPLIVPELSQFNFEINSHPHLCKGGMLRNLHEDLTNLWEFCEEKAEKLDLQILNIGILPTISDEMLSLNQIAPHARYYALNQQVLKMHHNKPIILHIDGKEHLEITHNDVMAESATTSLQIHLQISSNKAARAMNAAAILSAPMAALTANSPFFLGKELWVESRIPIFEQAIPISSRADESGKSVGRVLLGTGYVQKSMFELFLENRDRFPVLLPFVLNSDPNALNHVRLHNGTIWRWNRPIVGIGPKGTPNLRVEHRVPPAGPTIPDMIGNIAFFIGVMYHMIHLEEDLESKLPFELVLENFQNAAKLGFDAEIQWTDGKVRKVRDLLLKILIPQAQKGLTSLNIDEKDMEYYLDKVIHPRVTTGMTGSAWQSRFVLRHGSDFQKLTAAYIRNQRTHTPVHAWKL